MKKLAVLPLFLTSLAFAQDAEITFSSSEIEPGIFMVEAKGGFGGGNMAVLVGEGHVAMIDDSLPPLAENLLAHVTETAGGPIDFMVNTHVHGDHAGGNAVFADNGTVVFAHDNIRKRLLQDSSGAGGPGGLPVITFGDGVTFHLGRIEARVKHMPKAHTDGDAVIHFPGANVIHTGDILFHGIFPFIDLDNGGTVDGYIAAQQAIWSMADDETKIIPGHGSLTDKAGMKSDIDMLIDSKAVLKALIDQGKSADDVLEANPLAKYDSFNWAFITTERMTRTLIRSLTTD
ncbi:MAG: MBL fold metallo-hydrolase [Gammaproteobacteria bacterium]|nr:MBL fold metallo-hydrolase [Gammaproteobacteria bacterium]